MVGKGVRGKGGGVGVTKAINTFGIKNQLPPVFGIVMAELLAQDKLLEIVD